jgi:chromosome segregation ATPase
MGERESSDEPAFGTIGRTVGGTLLGGIGLAIIIAAYNAPQETADSARDATQLSALDITQIRAEAEGLRGSIGRLRTSISELQRRMGEEERRLATIEARFEERHIGTRRDISRLENAP